MFRAIVGAILFIKFGIPLIILLLEFLIENWYIVLSIILLIIIVSAIFIS